MEAFTIVRPEHLNHHGYLFGGQLLKWVDEYAWIAATRDYNGSLVTRAMEGSEFHKKVPNGSILRFVSTLFRQGKTSVTYKVQLYCDAPGSACETEVFTTSVTFVCLDEKGEKMAVERRLPQTKPC